MKNSRFFLLILTLAFLPLNSYSQDMRPPKPLDAKVFESMTGEWTGESNMMGTPTTEDVKIYWALNKQFIFMEVKGSSKNDPSKGYEGFGIFGVDAKGSVKVWWFDNWGASAISTGEGKFIGDNKLEVTDGNEMFREARTFEVTGDEMVMAAKGTFTMGGQEMPFDEKTVYKKK